ncbi:ATPase [Kocuria coralli]|uniref:ATPase n=1 Tax=Kocuria coralli TaxID=1461025 RepID=A0A5J5KXT1_9MICC|nr:ABC-ATPase domain-containing protein [Kocuria coralli]KAA9394454.1 ATPase [Kocuria coralli]
MRDLQTLHRILQELDGQGYGGYKRLKGMYDLGDFRLSVDHVQVDPYAPPSKVRAIFTREALALPPGSADSREQRIAAADFLARGFLAAVTARQRGAGGSPRSSRAAPRGRWGHDSGADESRAITAYPCGQEVIERSTVVISGEHVEVRFEVGLPAAGRRVKGRSADRILTKALPEVLLSSLAPGHRDDDALIAHVELYLDQLALRDSLAERDLVAFVGDGAILPRRSGDSALPLERGAVPFESPQSLRVAVDLPSGRRVTGMGVPSGITVIVGGGYHGKSTLLAALSGGVYPHIGGDGREWVLTREDAVAIRAEDGRAVTGVDISPFITGLPTGVDTRAFTTTNASGSTSQAANLVEALETGTSAVLIDEDTSATNFMIRDDRMKRLIPAHKEPITPFVDRVEPMLTQTGVSTVLVAGGSGAFFDVADHVIAMESYQPRDVTREARQIAADTPLADESGTSGVNAREVPPFRARTPRIVQRNSLAPASKSKGSRARGRTEIQVGREHIDLSAVSQLVDPGQTTAIAHVIDQVGAGSGGNVALEQLASEVISRLEREGLDTLGRHAGHPGYLAAPRRQELHGAINRYRGLRLANDGDEEPAS